ncbi:hypothetical protein BC332_07509 [Capsicum chinense]|nr:hypothetical protein BC332_07509 [Capsicum chinense]
MSLHLDKWITKEVVEVLEFNKVMTTTAFVMHSSTHDKESAATYPRGSKKGLATWNYPQSGFGSRGKLVKTRKGSSLPSLKLNDTLSVDSDKTQNQNNDSTMLENNSGKMPSKTPLKDMILPILLVNKVMDTNGDTSLMQGDQE